MLRHAAWLPGQGGDEHLGARRVRVRLRARGERRTLVRPPRDHTSGEHANVEHAHPSARCGVGQILVVERSEARRHWHRGTRIEQVVIDLRRGEAPAGDECVQSRHLPERGKPDPAGPVPPTPDGRGAARLRGKVEFVSPRLRRAGYSFDGERPTGVSGERRDQCDESDWDGAAGNLSAGLRVSA